MAVKRFIDNGYGIKVCQIFKITIPLEEKLKAERLKLKALL